MPWLELFCCCCFAVLWMRKCPVVIKMSKQYTHQFDPSQEHSCPVWRGGCIHGLWWTMGSGRGALVSITSQMEKKVTTLSFLSFCQEKHSLFQEGSVLGDAALHGRLCFIKQWLWTLNCCMLNLNCCPWRCLLCLLFCSPNPSPWHDSTPAMKPLQLPSTWLCKLWAKEHI